MTLLVTVVNFGLGVAYLGVGLMVLTDMKRGWRRMGFSHFGAAMVALAFTCGPHHLFHGIHLGFEGRTGGPLDFISVAVGLPTAMIWLFLRMEAFNGGRGDRFLRTTPRWMSMLPVAASAYVTAVIAAALQIDTGNGLRFTPSIIPNIILVGVYAAIGGVLLQAQLRAHRETGGWSVSGLTFMGIFPTCAVMHTVWAVYAAAGLYEFDHHGFVVDVLAIPAGLYFLWVTRQLHREALQDWNAPDAATGGHVRTGTLTRARVSS